MLLFGASSLEIDAAMPNPSATLRLLKTYLPPVVPRKVMPLSASVQATIDEEWNTSHPVRRNSIAGTVFADDGVSALKHALFALKFGDNRLFANVTWDEYCAETLVGVVLEARRLAETIRAASDARQK